MYETRVHFVSNLYDESCILTHDIIASSDEEAIRLARKWAKSLVGDVRQVWVLKDGNRIACFSAGK